LLTIAEFFVLSYLPPDSQSHRLGIKPLWGLWQDFSCW